MICAGVPYGGQVASQPSEITPQVGDTFTVSNRWLDLDASGKVSGTSYSDGETLTFSTEPFAWEQVYAPAGQYLVGFLVSDLDGNIVPAYTQIEIK